MILRRIIRHFRQQEWTAIALDFLIVVVGVIVGIQVSNWNTARLETRQGEVFADRLKADLRLEAWNYDVLVDYLRDVQTNADMALAILDGAVEASDEQLLINAYRATQYAWVARQRATYDELTSTGSVGLIQDAFLRETAVLVYNSPVIQLTIEEGGDSPYRIAFRKLVPVEAQDALAENCGDRSASTGDYGVIGNQLNYECASGLSPAQVAAAASSLRAAADIVPLLRLRAMNVRTHLGNLTFANREIMDKLHTIAGHAE